MKNLSIAIIAATMMCVAACSKSSKTVSAESMTLYAGDGYVQTPSPKYYRITKDIVMEDTLVWMNSEDVFDEPVPAERSGRAKELLNKITSGMLRENNKTYSSERIADAATNVITAVVNGKTYEWSITDDVESLPKHVRDFGAAVSEAAAQLEGK